MRVAPLTLTLATRDLEPEDLADLSWSGGPEHIDALAEALQASFLGEVALVVVALSNGRLVAAGGVDFRPSPDSGLLWMLAVHETFQSLGIGSHLVAALEQRVLGHGATTARLSVEHDNQRAAALYRRLGYREVGSTLDSWRIGGGRTYVTVSTVLERDLRNRV